MKWSEMSARERDILVAENVMGFAPVRPLDLVGTTSEILHEDGAWYYKDDGERDTEGVWHRHPDALPCWTPESRYTTSIAAAWEVVEKMRTSDFDCTFGVCSDGAWAKFFHYTESEGDYERGGHASVDPRDANEDWEATTCLAICEAAASAKGVEIE